MVDGRWICNTGADPGFFLGGGAHSFFWQNTSCIRKAPSHLTGRGVTPPRSAPATADRTDPDIFVGKNNFITASLSSSVKALPRLSLTCKLCSFNGYDFRCHQSSKRNSQEIQFHFNRFKSQHFFMESTNELLSYQRSNETAQ